jgi:hypothetical protein
VNELNIAFVINITNAILFLELFSQSRQAVVLFSQADELKLAMKPRF